MNGKILRANASSSDAERVEDFTGIPDATAWIIGDHGTSGQSAILMVIQ